VEGADAAGHDRNARATRRKPLLDELERGGLKVDRTRAAKGFARRLGEAVSELPAASVLQPICSSSAGRSTATRRVATPLSEGPEGWPPGLAAWPR